LLESPGYGAEDVCRETADRRDFREHLSTQAFRLGGQPAALLISEPKPPLAHLLAQDAIPSRRYSMTCN
jgi:hypothetical protein